MTEKDKALLAVLWKLQRIAEVEGRRYDELPDLIEAFESEATKEVMPNAPTDNRPKHGLSTDISTVKHGDVASPKSDPSGGDIKLDYAAPAEDDSVSLQYRIKDTVYRWEFDDDGDIGIMVKPKEGEPTFIDVHLSEAEKQLKILTDYQEKTKNVSVGNYCATFPSLPPGEQWHNPDNLAPECVGIAHGLRLRLKSEKENIDGDEVWEAMENRWYPASSRYTCNATYRTREPLPDRARPPFEIKADGSNEPEAAHVKAADAQEDVEESEESTFIDDVWAYAEKKDTPPQDTLTQLKAEVDALIKPPAAAYQLVECRALLDRAVAECERQDTEICELQDKLYETAIESASRRKSLEAVHQDLKVAREQLEKFNPSLHSYMKLRDEAIDERDAARKELGEVRESFPLCRMQDNFEKSALELAKLTVSRSCEAEVELKKVRKELARVKVEAYQEYRSLLDEHDDLKIENQEIARELVDLREKCGVWSARLVDLWVEHEGNLEAIPDELAAGAKKGSG